MGRRKKVDIQHEQEVLNSIVRADGTGEDPVVKAVLSEEFPKMNDSEALSVTAMLSELIRGQKIMSDDMARMKADMDRIDKATNAYERDRVKFVEQIVEQSKRFKDERHIAYGANELQKMVAEANATAKVNAMEKNAYIEQRIANDPKVSVVSPGYMAKISSGGGIEVKMMPEVLRVGKFRFVLQPGEITELPKIAADLWHTKHNDQEYAKEVKKVIAVKENNKMDDWDSMFAKVNKLGEKHSQTGMVMGG